MTPESPREIAQRIDAGGFSSGRTARIMARALMAIDAALERYMGFEWFPGTAVIEAILDGAAEETQS